MLNEKCDLVILYTQTLYIYSNKIKNVKFIFCIYIGFVKTTITKSPFYSKSLIISEKANERKWCEIFVVK